MKTTAVILAKGCEEGEALTIADILRRCEVPCDLIGLDSKTVTGAHGIEIECDGILGEAFSYDMIILPGGYEGVDHMKESALLKETLQKMDAQGKLIAALCAAPSVLDEAGVLHNRKYTCYPGVATKAPNRSDETIVADGTLLTGKGPALAWAFGYRAADLCGADSLSVKKRMVYFNAFDVKEEA
jgi:4-methyl-5(b-hydroxyethyl)-thiazole monophosphate biosynthesis